MEELGLTKEDYQKAIELTNEQKKAWNKFVTAVKSIKETNIYLYQVLDSIGALNGNNVKEIVDDPCGNHPGCTQWLDYPTIKTNDAWSDDNHIVILKNKDRV